MKNTMKFIVALLLALACAFSLTACADTPAETEAPANTEAADDTTEASGIEKTGLWATATYVTDTELGEGSNTVAVEVKAGDSSVKFTVNTDKTTVGAALLEHGIIAGEEGEYGLYVKVVNGITADYDVDRSYWAFYINGEYAMTGVESTEITTGAAYLLEYSK